MLLRFIAMRMIFYFLLLLLQAFATAAADVVINYENFENGWGIFNDGGGDVRRSSVDSEFAYSGNFAIRLRDNSRVASSMFTDPFDVSDLSEVSVSFFFVGDSMENNENLFLEWSSDFGPWQIQADYVFGSEELLENNQFYFDEVDIDVPPGASTMRIRFRCDASTNGDRVFIDNVLIEGTAAPSPIPTPASILPNPSPIAAANDVSGTAWINEFHYDNDGTDVGEFIEIAYINGADITSYQVILYNGNGGGTYNAFLVPDGTATASGLTLSVIDLPSNSIQNGAPDGIALVDSSNNVLEFLSYEGTFVASNGPAAGLVSIDIGVSEATSTPVGFSLQRSGSGCSSIDFKWSQPDTATKGYINNGQIIACGSSATSSPFPTPSPVVPVPGAPVSSQGVKVMTYNILGGGTADTQWKDIIKLENPDIIVFTEVGNWDDDNNALLKQNLNEFNNHFASDEAPYYGSTVQGSNFANSANAIMTRFPIVETTQLTDAVLSSASAHDLMVWKLDVGNRNSFVYVIGIHLKCCGGTTNNNRRNDTMRNLIAWIDANISPSDSVMLMGDFNSVSPVDTDPTFPGYKSAFEPSSGSSLNDGPLRMLLDSTNADASTTHTFQDAFREANPICDSNPTCCSDTQCDSSLLPSCPERGYTYVSNANNYDSRIDFIIVNQQVQVTGEATVGNLGAVCTASDHLPVDVMVDFKNIQE